MRKGLLGAFIALALGSLAAAPPVASKFAVGLLPSLPDGYLPPGSWPQSASPPAEALGVTLAPQAPALPPAAPPPPIPLADLPRPGPAPLNPGAAPPDPLAGVPVVPASPPTGSPSCPAAEDGGEPTPPAERFWASGEYLLWWIKGSPLPPLVTTGDPNAARPGALGQQGTQVLYGGNVNEDVFSGGRFAAGYWLNDEHTLGFDGSFFFLGRRSDNFAASSPGFPVLALPFVDARTGQEDASLVALPGVLSGAVSASLSTRLWGAELNARRQVLGGPWWNLALLGGFRYLDLTETLQLSSRDTFRPALSSLGPVGLSASEQFGARNYFYGGQMGADASVRWGRLSADVVGKVALGSTHEIAVVSGQTTLQGFTGPALTIPGAGLAQPSNFGRHSRDVFAAVPEVGLTLGYNITPRLQATFGYTFLYCSNVLRPGDAIDRVVNLPPLAPQAPAALLGPARPTFGFHDSDVWAQGIRFGLTFRY